MKNIPKIEQWMIDEAKAAGACEVRYQAGQYISEVSFEDLHWVQATLPKIQHRLKLEYPLYVYSSGDGFGFGDGDGSGSGDGYGFNNGDGSGSGYGDGYIEEQFKKGEIE